MERRSVISLILTHIALAVLIYIIIAVPKSRGGLASPAAFIAVILLIEAFYMFHYIWNMRDGGSRTGVNDITFFVWVILILWELWTSVSAAAHPVLIPSPENVFNVFRDKYPVLLKNIAYSMELLLGGMAIGLIVATMIGLYAGWNKRFHDFLYPIANVMTPIPAIVISPYLVLLMPTFRSASMVVIILGVFWPTLLGTINRITEMDSRILDSARMLHPSTTTMIWKILLPYIFPGIISGLKVTMTTSMLMLNFAELMGATHGMGYFIQNSITYANYTQAVAGTIIVGIVVSLFSWIITKIQNRLIRY
jgi:NitT/TauT family transport system permease protein